MKADKWVQLTPLATEDLEVIHDFIAQQSPARAQKAVRELLQRAQSLAAFPELGRIEEALAPAGRYRSLIAGQHKLIYRVDGDIVWILRIWDARRDPKDLRPE